VAVNFDARAEGWDTPQRAERAGKLAAEMARRLPAGAFSRVLEFGCGTGLLSFSLMDRIGTALLVDSSEGMIDIVRKKIADARAQGRVSALCRDIARGVATGERFSCAYSSMSLHHIRDVSPAAKAICALLAPGGYLCVIDLRPDNGLFHRHEAGFDGHDGFEPAALAAVFEAEGLDYLSSDTVFSGERDIDGTRHGYALFMLVMRKKG